jgi:TonB family protein
MASSSQKISVVTACARFSLVIAVLNLLSGPGKLDAADPVGLMVVVGKDIHGKILSEKETKKCALETPYPEYPAEAMRRGITGTGIYELRIDPKTGRVKGVVVIAAAGDPMLDRESIRTLLKWRFKPGTVVSVRLPFGMMRMKGDANSWVF